MPARGLGFDAPVAPSGYAWWYVDALSDDGQHGLTIIGFVGSVFSPYYAWQRRRGPADPSDHCAVNVVLYGPRAERWAMTERGRASLARTSDSLMIGPSAMRWDGTGLTIAIDERGAPLPLPLKGTVRVRPAAVVDRSFPLDAAGRHWWRPFAPASRVEVALEQPALRWSGAAYLDQNTGDEPLEAAFSTWHWSRAITRAGAAVLYDVDRRDGTACALALSIDRTGTLSEGAPRPAAALPRTRWRLARVTRADPGHQPTVTRTLTDAPFYARSLLASRLDGEPVVAVHESLSLDRFTQPLVQAMLPFRMPRWRR